jgi:glycerol kinase
MATAKGHIARAVAEGIAASVAVQAGAVAADLGGPLTALRVDGGLTRSRVLLQAQADLLGVPVLVSRTPDATALGVAALARLGQGESGSPSAEVALTVHPVMSRDEAAERLSRYSHALTSTLT